MVKLKCVSKETVNICSFHNVRVLYKLKQHVSMFGLQEEFGMRRHEHTSGGPGEAVSHAPGLHGEFRARVLVTRARNVKPLKTGKRKKSHKRYFYLLQSLKRLLLI